MNWQDHLATEIEDQWNTADHRGFDFWVGEWHANWRDPQEGDLYHADEGDWTHQYVFPTLGGKAIIELAEQREVAPNEAQPHGFSIRYFDEARQRWVMAQHWPSPGFPGIAFMDQLIGVDRHGRREVYSHLARPNAAGGFDYRRYVFSDITHDGFRWDGSNSSDEGVSWTTWNVVEFHRLADLPPLTTPGHDLPTYHQGAACTEDPHRNMNGLRGSWQGEMTDADGNTAVATFVAGRILDGCGLLGLIQVPDRDYMLLNGWSYTNHFNHWVNFRLDNQQGTTHEYRVSPDAAPEIFSLAPGLAIQDEYAQLNVAEAMQTDDALSRTLIEDLTATSFTLRDQIRESIDADWADERVYRFEKK